MAGVHSDTLYLSPPGPKDVVDQLSWSPQPRSATREVLFDPILTSSSDDPLKRFGYPLSAWPDGVVMGTVGNGVPIVDADAMGIHYPKQSFPTARKNKHKGKRPMKERERPADLISE